MQFSGNTMNLCHHLSTIIHEISTEKQEVSEGKTVVAQSTICVCFTWQMLY